MFDTLVAETRLYLERSVASSGRIRPTDDEHGRAQLMEITSLGSQLLAEYLEPPARTRRRSELIPEASDRLMLRRARAVHPRAVRRLGVLGRLPSTPGQRHHYLRSEPTMTNAIDIRGLTKSFGSARALDGLNLTVTTGEVHGFLGPNGSGKSTTIRVLLGLLRADGGHVELLGGDPWRDAVDLHIDGSPMCPAMSACGRR